MLLGAPKNPVQRPTPPTPDLNAKNSVETGEDSINFDKMLYESNKIKQEELEKEKNAQSGDGSFHIGETKDEKQFRETLEKITGKKQDKLKNKMDRDDYLTLLVTQLKHQDPSKPMEHYEMASQMAQFNTVEQLVGVNKALSEMKKMQSEANSDKLTQFIGKYVEVKGNQINLGIDNKTSSAQFELNTGAQSATIEVKDSQMKTVRTLKQDQLEPGKHPINWNGTNEKNEKMPPGTYSFSISAFTKEGKPVNTKSSYLARVEGISNIDTGGNLETKVGKVKASDVIAIRNYEDVH